MPAKIMNPATAAVEKPVIDDGRKVFGVKPGVDWIAGQRLRGRTEIRLNDAEAAYDLSLERIKPIGEPDPASWGTKVKAEAPAAPKP